MRGREGERVRAPAPSMTRRAHAPSLPRRAPAPSLPRRACRPSYGAGASFDTETVVKGAALADGAGENPESSASLIMAMESSSDALSCRPPKVGTSVEALGEKSVAALAVGVATCVISSSGCGAWDQSAHAASGRAHNLDAVGTRFQTHDSEASDCPNAKEQGRGDGLTSVGSIFLDPRG